nr:hypothetical protein [Tanacetum cinerariifolium]
MHVYVELVENDEEHDSDSDSVSDSESENEIVDGEHVVDKVEVNMNNFKFQIDEEDESSDNDVIVPNVNATEDNLEVLDFDSLESDPEDVPENARSLGLRKLKKKHSSSKFFIAFRVKVKAQVYLRGDVKVQYALLRDYVCELKRCNPDTTVKIDVYGEEDPKTPTRMFRRIYVCLGALKRRFREGGREFLGLDAIPISHSSQTGKRVYYQHLQSSFHLLIIGRAHYDLLINNVCKVFNRQLLDTRDSLIITALEFVREYLMKRIVIVQKVIQKCDGPQTPTIAKLFDKIKAGSLGCTVEWNGSELYQVKGSHPEQYVVNLTQKTCSCRKWEISGIPCKHAIAAIHDMTDNSFDVGIPEDWVHESYKLQTWMNDYSYKIGRPPKKRKKSKGEIAMVKGNKLTRQCKIVTCSLCQAARHNKRSCSSVSSQRNESVPKKTTGTKRISSVTGTSIASTKVGTQASQAGTQASSGSTFKRTKKYESRLTPEK